MEALSRRSANITNSSSSPAKPFISKAELGDCSASSADCAIEEDCIGGLILEAFDDSDKSDKVGTDVVLLHGSPQRCLPNPVLSLLEAFEDMVEVLLVLEIFLTKVLRS